MRRAISLHTFTTLLVLSTLAAPVLAKLPARGEAEAEEGADKPVAKAVERSAAKGRGGKPAARAS